MEWLFIIWFAAVTLFGGAFVVASLVAATLGAVYLIVVMFRRMSSRNVG